MTSYVGKQKKSLNSKKNRKKIKKGKIQIIKIIIQSSSLKKLKYNLRKYMKLIDILFILKNKALKISKRIKK